MDRSHYIEKIADAEYQVIGSGPLVESTPGVQLSGFYSSIVDLITAGRRGQGITWALNGTELSTDPAALQAAYDEHPDEIDNYLQHVDIDQIIQNITQPGEEEPYGIEWFRRRAPAFLAGAGIVAAGSFIFRKTTN